MYRTQEQNICTYPCQSVSQSVSEWVIVSDFGDSYRIYQACELAQQVHLPILKSPEHAPSEHTHPL